MPFIHPHLALMPDAHLGKGATVGSVIPTLGAIMPAAVGVDIGCGMLAVKTQYHRDELIGDLAELRRAIEAAIPLSAGRYNTRLTATAEGRAETLTTLADKAGFDPAMYAANWRLQLGSLGSGNHFIEVTVDEGGMVWLFLHSGSRGVGNKIATHHIRVAQEAMKRWWIDLPHGTSGRVQLTAALSVAVLATPYLCHHNSLTSRCGCPERARSTPPRGVLGLIPGSMGAASYVVVGKGNRLALNSSPHGAGRNYSRSAARKTFTGDQLRGDGRYRVPRHRRVHRRDPAGVQAD